MAKDDRPAYVQGSGTRVAQLHRIGSQLVIRDIHEEVAERGHVHTTRVAAARQEKAGAQVAASLGLRKGAPVFHTVLVHLEDGVPIQYEDRYVNPEAAPQYLQVDFTRTSPTSHLLRHAPPTEASYSIEACLPTAGSQVASVARQLYPGSRYSFNGTFHA